MEYEKSEIDVVVEVALCAEATLDLQAASLVLVGGCTAEVIFPT